MIKCVNNFVATEPLEDQTVKLKERSGFGSIDQKISIVPLKVLFAAEINGVSFSAGDAVFVRGEAYTTPWAKKIFSVDGAEFILVPMTEILLHEAE